MIPKSAEATGSDYLRHQSKPSTTDARLPVPAPPEVSMVYGAGGNASVMGPDAQQHGADFPHVLQRHDYTVKRSAGVSSPLASRAAKA